MPIVRPRGTSVKERIAAIENNGSRIETDNTVIQGKYNADVKGINRYKHFHMPNLINDVNSNGFGKETTHLPHLVKPAQYHVGDGDGEIGMEKAFRKKKKPLKLPQLTNNVPLKSPTNKIEKDLVTHIEEQAKLAMHKLSSGSDSSAESQRSGKQQMARLSPAPKRTFATLGHRQNGLIISHPMNNLEVALPPRSKSAQDLENRKKFDKLPPITPTEPTTPSLKESKDMATQTFPSQKMKTTSTASVEFLHCAQATQTDNFTLVAYPTRSAGPGRPNENVEMDLEKVRVGCEMNGKHEEVMEIIEGSVFCKEDDILIHTTIEDEINDYAVKQAQIWQDVKFYLARSLIPQAVVEAEKNITLAKSFVEVIASPNFLP